MSYTEADLNNVKNALLNLAMGKRVVSVSLANKSIQYAQADMEKLEKLLAVIQADLDAAAGQPSFYLTSTSKGL